MRGIIADLNNTERPHNNCKVVHKFLTYDDWNVVWNAGWWRLDSLAGRALGRLSKDHHIKFHFGGFNRCTDRLLTYYPT